MDHVVILGTILLNTICATHCNTLQHTATHCNTLQHTATHCNTLQHTATHTATHCNTLPKLHHTATHCVMSSPSARRTLQHTLQHTATHCNALQHTATHRVILHKVLTVHKTDTASTLFHLQQSATHCNTLQHTLQRTATHTATHCNTLQNTTTQTLQALYFNRYNIILLLFIFLSLFLLFFFGCQPLFYVHSTKNRHPRDPIFFSNFFLIFLSLSIFLGLISASAKFAQFKGQTPQRSLLSRSKEHGF